MISHLTELPPPRRVAPRLPPSCSPPSVSGALSTGMSNLTGAVMPNHNATRYGIQQDTRESWLCRYDRAPGLGGPAAVDQRRTWFSAGILPRNRSNLVTLIRRQHVSGRDERKEHFGSCWQPGLARRLDMRRGKASPRRPRNFPLNTRRTARARHAHGTRTTHGVPRSCPAQRICQNISRDLNVVPVFIGQAARKCTLLMAIIMVRNGDTGARW